MIKKLALIVPGVSGAINPPGKIPQGGLGKLIAMAGNGMGIVIGFGVVLALIFILWSAIEWISAQGDKQKIAKARARLIYVFLGLILIFGSFAIINFISQITGVNVKNPTSGF